MLTTLTLTIMWILGMSKKYFIWSLIAYDNRVISC